MFPCLRMVSRHGFESFLEFLLVLLNGICGLSFLFGVVILQCFHRALVLVALRSSYMHLR